MQEVGRTREEFVRRVIYKFFDLQYQHPKWFISLYTIETCGLLLLYNNSEDVQFFHEFTSTIYHSGLTNQSTCIDLVNIIILVTGCKNPVGRNLS